MHRPTWPPLRVVLLDADGVLQRRRPGLVRSLLKLGGPRFLADAMRAEVGCLTGERDFPDALAQAMRRHRVQAYPADVAQGWLDIVVDPRRLELVDAVRARGVRVALATNQHRFRGLHMREVLRLDEHFDAAYYSFELGAAKPDAGYFTRVLDDLGEPPETVLFVDDLPDNVRAARSLGIDARLHLWRTGVTGLRRTLASRL
ncbi:MAG: HAD-IA family hydrolase [Micropruina sp.]|uniref:HAD-IA family hydrolase n=1 Tax=Micropruina sp. TaxID=2737536 RepID=UPI0039E53417